MNLIEFLKDRHVYAVLRYDFIERIVRRLMLVGSRLGGVIGFGLTVPWWGYMLFKYICFAVFTFSIFSIWILPAFLIWEKASKVLGLGNVDWEFWDFVAMGFLTIVFLQFFNFIKGVYYSMSQRSVGIRFVLSMFYFIWVTVCIGYIFWFFNPLLWVFQNRGVGYLLCTIPFIIVAVWWAFKLIQLKKESPVFMFDRSFDKGYNYVTEKL
jgi:hypothetical protein